MNATHGAGAPSLCLTVRAASSGRFLFNVSACCGRFDAVGCLLVSGISTLNARGASGTLSIMPSYAERVRCFATPVRACDDRSADSERTTTQVRSPSPVQSLLAGLTLIVALLSLAALRAPTAKADAIDTNFISALKAKGIDFPSPQAAIIAGHQVCDELDSGRAASDVANDVMGNSNLDGYHAGFFVGVSVAAFCPRHAGQS